MSLFRRKQGRIATVTAMSRFTEAEREQGMRMLEAAEEVFVDLSAPSRLGTALFSATIGSMGIESESSAWGVAAGASLLGYACRMADPAISLPARMTSDIEAELIFTDDGEPDYAAIGEEPERLGALLELTATIASDPGAIATLADVKEAAWQAFSTTATFQLHQNLVRNGLPKRQLPSHDAVENLLRLGYVIGLVDEIAGAKPIDKNGQPIERVAESLDDLDEADQLPPDSPLDVTTWLSDASSVCANDFETFAEYLLQKGTLEVLSVESFDKLVEGDAASIALSNARFGHALRNREVQLIAGARAELGEDALADELDSRDTPSALNSAAIIRAVVDGARYGYGEGRDAVLGGLPGTTADARSAAIEAWAVRYFPGDDPYVGAGATRDLVRYGYLLHRVFEVRPERLEN